MHADTRSILIPERDKFGSPDLVNFKKKSFCAVSDGAGLVSRRRLLILVIT